jgi:hypothetical protein
MIRLRACRALAIGSYGVTPPPASITLRASATSAAQTPASSNASMMRSAKDVGQRGMDSRERPAPPAPWLRNWPRSHAGERGSRPADVNATSAWHCPHAGRGRGNADEYQALLNCGWPPVGPGGSPSTQATQATAMTATGSAHGRVWPEDRKNGVRCRRCAR